MTPKWKMEWNDGERGMEVVVGRQGAAYGLAPRRGQVVPHASLGRPVVATTTVSRRARWPQRARFDQHHNTPTNHTAHTRGAARRGPGGV